MSSRVPRWIFGCLALLCALIAGAALGVLLFAYIGVHSIAVSTTARVAGYLIGLLFGLLGAFCIVAFARYPRGAPPPSREHHGATVPSPFGAPRVRRDD